MRIEFEDFDVETETFQRIHRTNTHGGKQGFKPAGLHGKDRPKQRGPELRSVVSFGKSQPHEMTRIIRDYAKSDTPTRIKEHLASQQSPSALIRAWERFELEGNLPDVFSRVKGMVFNQLAYEWLKDVDDYRGGIVSPNFTHRILNRLPANSFRAHGLSLDGKKSTPAITRVIIASVHPTSPTQQDILEQALEFTQRNHDRQIRLVLPSTDTAGIYPPIEAVTFTNQGVDLVVPRDNVPSHHQPDVNIVVSPFSQNVTATIANATIRDILKT